MSERVQLRRTLGWRLPAGAITVARPTRWGNPFRVASQGAAWPGDMFSAGAGFYQRGAATALPAGPYRLTAEQAVDLYRRDLLAALEGDDDRAHELRQALSGLRGHDLACWCRLDQPCHADVLLALANQPTRPAAAADDGPLGRINSR